MIDVLLDTHVVLWWLADDERLGPTARDAITRQHCAVSAASIWEIEIKRALGKLTAPANMVSLVKAQQFDELSISFTDAAAAGRLPAHHRDPFDRMLIAQAFERSLVVMTADTAFDAYGIAMIQAAK